MQERDERDSWVSGLIMWKIVVPLLDGTLKGKSVENHKRGIGYADISSVFARVN